MSEIIVVFAISIAVSIACACAIDKLFKSLFDRQEMNE